MDEAATTSGLRAGERRYATILFSDIAGFTTLSEGTDPEELDGVMSDVFAAFEEVIRRHGGSVEKYIGDALVAVFGVPDLHEDDPVRAVSAAIEFRAALTAVTPGVQFRTGIHFGLVTTGTRGDFDVVTGHAMAVASRLQTAAEPGEILVSNEVYAQTHRWFEFSAERTLRAKGKRELIRSYSVTGVRAARAESEEPFVGRDGLLSTLTSLYLQCSAGTPTAAVLVGAPGMGASRVAERFVEEVREFPRFDAQVIVTRPSVSSKSPYSAIWGAAQQLSERDEWRAEFPLEHYEAAAGFLVEGGVGSSPAELAEPVAALLGASIRGFESVFPPIVVIDNLEEISAEERNLFRILVQRTKVHAFFVATSVLGDESAVRLLPNATVLEVPPFTVEETAEYIKAIKNGTPDEEFVLDVHDRTGGNPRFISELFRYLETNPDTESIPSGIQTVVLVGLQGLPPGPRELLRRLSVFDHPFRPSDAGRVGGETSSEEALSVLVSRGYLTRESGRFRFGNELVRGSIYDSLLNQNKRVLHALAAESVTADELSALVPIRHLVAAERFAEAADRIESSSAEISFRRDRRVLEPLAAVLKSGVSLGKEQLANLLYLRFAVLYNTNADPEEYVEAARALLRLGMTSGNRLILARAYAVLTAVHAARGALHAARHTGRQAVRYYDQLGWDERADFSRDVLGEVCGRLGLLDERDSLIGEVRLPTARLLHRANVALDRMELWQGFQHARAALDRSTQDSSIPAILRAETVLVATIALVLARDWDGVFHLAEEIERELAAEYLMQSIGYSALAMAAHHRGDNPGAQRFIERAAYLSHQTPSHPKWSSPKVFLGLARLEVGQRDAAATGLTEVYFDLADSPSEPLIPLTLVFIVRALDEGESRSVYLGELDTLIRDLPWVSDYVRMEAAWLRYRLADGSDEDLARAHDLASSIVTRQGESRFAATIRAGSPYRDIRVEWERRNTDGGS